MRDLQIIRAVNREAAERAADQSGFPVIIEQEDVDDYLAGLAHGIKIPTLGEYLPDDWERVNVDTQHGVYDGDNLGFGAYFVDHSGFGAPGEAAMTMHEFFEALEPGLGYAVVETGQFQLKVGAFQRVNKDGKKPLDTPCPVL